MKFGFKPGHSTSPCTFVLKLLNVYLDNDSAVYILLLYAFDRVKCCKLFDILSYLRLIIHMNVSQKLLVKWADVCSTDFKCINGVKHCGILSPILFCVYVDELLFR